MPDATGLSRRRGADPSNNSEGVLKSGYRSLEFRLQPGDFGSLTATDRLKAGLQHFEDTLSAQKSPGCARAAQVSCGADETRFPAKSRGEVAAPRFDVTIGQ